MKELRRKQDAAKQVRLTGFLASLCKSRLLQDETDGGTPADDQPGLTSYSFRASKADRVHDGWMHRSCDYFRSSVPFLMVDLILLFYKRSFPLRNSKKVFSLSLSLQMIFPTK
jgi:hypothetical protein